MVRLEIMVNSALEADVLEILEHSEGTGFFTKINNVHGLGSSGPRRGDHIWPEENIMLIIYVEKDVSLGILKGLDIIKGKFPDEGLKYFTIEQ